MFFVRAKFSSKVYSMGSCVSGNRAGMENLIILQATEDLMHSQKYGGVGPKLRTYKTLYMAEGCVL